MNWLHRAPRTAGDWLKLMGAGAAIWFGLGLLPALAQWGALGFQALSPFAGGLVLAYILDIPTRFFAAKLCNGRRGPAILFSYLLFLGIVGVLIGLVVPQLLQSATDFATHFPSYTLRLSQLLHNLEQTTGLDTSPLTGLLENSSNMVQQLVNRIPQLVLAAAGAADRALDLVVALAASAYFLAGKETLLQTVHLVLRAGLAPRSYGNVLAVARLANRTFCGYIGGQLLDAALVGGEVFLLMALLHLQYAPLISVLVGVTNIIPVLGPFIGAVPGALILLLGGNFWQAAEFILIILIVQQVDGNFIAPRILGDATGLSGLGVLFAIVLGGEFFGFAGMVAGVPVLAVVAALVRQALDIVEKNSREKD